MSLAAISGGDGVPPEPDWNETYTDVLDLEVARREWGTVVRDLQAAGTLSVANGHAIKRLVEFRVIYERAAKSLGETGAVLRAKRTRVPQVNPSWPIMRQASEQIVTIETALCLTPRHRGAATKVAKKAGVQRAADAYIKPRGV